MHKSENKPLLICGIQPSNRLTIGNYLGAIKEVIKAQEKYKCYIFVADLHALTVPVHHHTFNATELEEFKRKIIKMYIAAGINPNKSIIFVQSTVKEHLELFYFLLTHSSVGELKRMTQYKDLSKKFREPNGTESSLAGLLTYPVLMAADILLYDTDYVAIGEDQTQHLELTKNLARKINERYKQEIFKVPKSLNSRGEKAGIKIKDLQNPTKKMSKSSESHDGVIFLDDDLEVIKNKIMKAKTDSIEKINLDEEKQPGIFNLLNIYASITNMDIKSVHEKLKDLNYKQLKETVADVVVNEIKEIQKNYENMKNFDIDKLININKQHCQELAQIKINQIKFAK